jgi:hypothetical protein
VNEAKCGRSIASVFSAVRSFEARQLALMRARYAFKNNHIEPLFVKPPWHHKGHYKRWTEWGGRIPVVRSRREGTALTPDFASLHLGPLPKGEGCVSSTTRRFSKRMENRWLIVENIPGSETTPSC